MRHGVLGVGGVGGLLGAALARSGADVTLVLRPESLAAYPGRLRVESAVLGDFEVDVPAVGRLDAPVDVLWVTPKAYQLEAATALAPPEHVASGRVIPLMNGVDHLTTLRSTYGEVVAGAIRVESERVATGHIRQTSPFIRVQVSDGHDICGALQAAGVDCEIHGDELSLLWQKLAFLAPVALATTAFGVTFGEVRGSELFRRCQAETVAVGVASGATIDDSALEALTTAAPAGLRSSMQKDRENGRPLELDAIAGPIIRGGSEFHLPTPATEHLSALITAD